MKTVVLIPWRSDNGGRRDQLWDFTRNWLDDNHPDFTIITHDSGEGPFNRGRAINNAAAREDWDVAIVHDADNIADPEQVKLATERADRTGMTVFPFQAYMYLDEHSTTRLMSGEQMFLCPYPREDLKLPWVKPYEHTLRHRHYSGVQVIPRLAWEQVGGFIEMDGWGAEDASMKVLFDTFSAGVDWQQGTALHLWHEPAWRSNDRKARRLSHANHVRLRRIKRRRGNPRSLRELMREYGHIVPAGSAGDFNKSQKLHDDQPTLKQIGLSYARQALGRNSW
jgi:Glycosyl transferase family 2